MVSCCIDYSVSKGVCVKYSLFNCETGHPILLFILWLTIRENTIPIWLESGQSPPLTVWVPTEDKYKVEREDNHVRSA